MKGMVSTTREKSKGCVSMQLAPMSHHGPVCIFTILQPHGTVRWMNLMHLTSTDHHWPVCTFTNLHKSKMTLLPCHSHHEAGTLFSTVTVIERLHTSRVHTQVSALLPIAAVHVCHHGLQGLTDLALRLACSLGCSPICRVHAGEFGGAMVDVPDTLSHIHSC